MADQEQAEVDNVLLIADDSGTIYKIDNWRKSAKKLNPTAVGIPSQLVNLGVVTAYIPQDFAAGCGSCCYFLNIGAIVKGDRQPQARNPVGQEYPNPPAKE